MGAQRDVISPNNASVPVSDVANSIPAVKPGIGGEETFSDSSYLAAVSVVVAVLIALLYSTGILEIESQ